MENAKHETVKSVGIDIGTTTTQLVISRLTIKNTAPGTLVPRMAITDKVVEYKSPIYLTPIQAENRIDVTRVFDIVHQVFQEAGVRPGDIDTGAVIITGETAKKENARNISQALADFSGEFVVATAGGRLESIIAGKGSGAADYSKQHSCTVANIDIGGGTANIGVFKNGKVVDSCCVNIGGRLLQIDRATECVTHLAEPMQPILNAVGVNLKVGGKAGMAELRRLAQKMAAVVWQCLSPEISSSLMHALLMTEALKYSGSIDGVMISGGVADDVYSSRALETLQDVIQYGDIGPLLGKEVSKVVKASDIQLLTPIETIRATVIGAGARTVEVSGSTIQVDNALLPMKDIPVVSPLQAGAVLEETALAKAVQNSIATCCDGETIHPIALTFQSVDYWGFKDVQTLAKGVLRGAETLIQNRCPLILVVAQDIGKVLGQSLKVLNPGVDVICIDQVTAAEGDYLDIGKLMAGDTVVPVVIKTLVFESGIEV